MFVWVAEKFVSDHFLRGLTQNTITWNKGHSWPQSGAWCACAPWFFHPLVLGVLPLLVTAWRLLLLLCTRSRLRWWPEGAGFRPRWILTSLPSQDNHLAQQEGSYAQASPGCHSRLASLPRLDLSSLRLGSSPAMLISRPSTRGLSQLRRTVLCATGRLEHSERSPGWWFEACSMRSAASGTWMVDDPLITSGVQIFAASFMLQNCRPLSVSLAPTWRFFRNIAWSHSHHDNFAPVIISGGISI